MVPKHKLTVTKKGYRNFGSVRLEKDEKDRLEAK